MATITFENVRNVKPYYDWDLRVLTGFNAVPNYSYADKAATIKSLLERSMMISSFVDDNTYWSGALGEVRVRLHTLRETATPVGRVNNFCFGTISQISLANKSHEVGKTPYKTVHIEMDSWYFENYPLGYCTGMLCHEFAVHHMGDYQLAYDKKKPVDTEKSYYEKGGTNEGKDFGTKHKPLVNPSKAGQTDHVFAAYPEWARYNVYQETVMEVAGIMASRSGKSAPSGEVTVTDADVTDLFKCYLMDVASIQSTNDHRAKGIMSPSALADCYNIHRKLLLDKLGVSNPLAAFVPGTTNATQVVKDFLYLLASLAWSLGPNWSASWSGY
ncbi:MAG: hypothetical protein QM820_01215 [Minicystis sp.]